MKSCGPLAAARLAGRRPGFPSVASVAAAPARDFKLLIQACGAFTVYPMGTHSDITATDQIRPIATTTTIPIPMHVRICIRLYGFELGEGSHTFCRPNVR